MLNLQTGARCKSSLHSNVLHALVSFLTSPKSYEVRLHFGPLRAKNLPIPPCNMQTIPASSVTISPQSSSAATNRQKKRERERGKSKFEFSPFWLRHNRVRPSFMAIGPRHAGHPSATPPFSAFSCEGDDLVGGTGSAAREFDSPSGRRRKHGCGASGHLATADCFNGNHVGVRKGWVARRREGCRFGFSTN